MAPPNGEGPDHRTGGVEARDLEQLGRRLEVLATTETPTRQDRAVRVVVTSTGRKWRATLGDEVVCIAAAPLVASARVLIGRGFNPERVIEMWRLGADSWALRGRLGAVAETVLDGEMPTRHARNGSPVRRIEGGATAQRLRALVPAGANDERRPCAQCRRRAVPGKETTRLDGKGRTMSAVREYQASHVKRHRSTKAEVAARRDALFEIVSAMKPITRLVEGDR